MSDSEVIELIVKGDERAIDYLYKKHYRMMVNIIKKNNGSEDEAKDVFQDALVVFWQKVSSRNLVLTSKISTYLYSICQNLWRKELDRKIRLSNESTDFGDNPEEDSDKSEKIKIVNDCINSMGETCRKILTLYYFEEYSMAEIAEQMGFANADTAKTKKYKCKQELDKIIKSKFSVDDFMD